MDSLSQKYAVASVVTLLLLLLIDNARAQLIVSAVGIGIGIWVASRDTSRRAGLFALVGFVVVAAIAAVVLLRS